MSIFSALFQSLHSKTKNQTKTKFYGQALPPKSKCPPYLGNLHLFQILLVFPSYFLIQYPNRCTSFIRMKLICIKRDRFGPHILSIYHEWYVILLLAVLYTSYLWLCSYRNEYARNLLLTMFNLDFISTESSLP